MNFFFLFFNLEMGNIESVDGQSEMKHHIMPLKVPMPDPSELEEKFAIVLVSFGDPLFFLLSSQGEKSPFGPAQEPWFVFQLPQVPTLTQQGSIIDLITLDV